MRRFLLLLFVVFLSMTAFAQLEVKKGSFKEVPGFVNVNSDPNYQNDDNDLPFAVIKVRTENITDKQRRELKFEGNAGTFIMLEYKTGEVWVYLTARYADYLKISHPDLSSTEYTFPYDLKPKCGYEMTLVNTSPNIDKNNYLIVKADQQNAKIYIDDELMGTGYASKVVSIGEEHRYRVSCDDYFPKEGLVYFDNREDKEISVNLEPNFGYITIKSDPSGAEVYIDEVKVGVTPYLMKKITPGDHVVELRKVGYESYADMVTIQVREKNVQMENVKLVENKSVAEQKEVEQPVMKQEVQTKEIAVNNVVTTNKDINKHNTVNGVFSVAADKKVQFSKGNLQYQASTKTWRFAEHQWDAIGDDNKNISSSYSGWIDLFGWGTGDNPTKSSTHSSAYSSFNDWGDNFISNGGGKSWRTLTKDEWEYVLNTRNTNSGMRYAKAVVNGVNGVIVFPDNWNKTNYKINDANDGYANYKRNVISKDSWNRVFEPNDAVFLPAAGNTWSGGIVDFGLRSCYWSATIGTYGSAYCLVFEDSVYHIMQKELRGNGFSVRLVCDVE